MVANSIFKEKCASLIIKGADMVKKFNEASLYKSSAGKILVYDSKKTNTDIVFRKPPKEPPVFKEGAMLNVFKK